MSGEPELLAVTAIESDGPGGEEVTFRPPWTAMSHLSSITELTIRAAAGTYRIGQRITVTITEDPA